MTIELLRPDDLLNLRIDAVNMRVDAANPEAPVLVVEDPQQPAYLRFIFPPQTIAESAFFEAAIVQPPEADPSNGGKPKIIKPELDPDRPDPETDPENTAHKTTGDPLPAPGQVKARPGQASRLVFTVPPDARIPFSIEGLLDWSDLEPSIHPIAAIGPNPTSEQIAQAPAIQEPTPNDTALELPYRLVISPNRDVVWNHRAQPFTARGRTELWHTRLQQVTAAGPVELSREHRAPLRAIWSPDYNPFQRPDPFAPDPVLNRTAMSMDDRHQIVVLTSAFHGYEVEIVVGAPLAAANLVPEPVVNPVLQPAGGLALQPAGVPAGAPAVQPEGVAAGLLNGNPALQALGDGAFAGEFDAEIRLIPFKIKVPYVPQPFEAEQLMLSPLGGWLHSRGHWTPPSTTRPIVVLPRIDFDDLVMRFRLNDPRLRLSPEKAIALADEVVSRPIVFPQKIEQLDLSEWVHIATQGRDHYVRIVYEGELWPFRHRAALIKVTERKFKENNGLVVAYLVQRMFIVVREPVKVFAATDRGNPFKQVRLTTLITPDIADPVRIPGTARSFWVEVMTSATTRDLFRFHAVGTDIAGGEVDFTVPLMFVSISDVPVGSALTKVAQEYNAKANIDRRNVRIPGQKVTFAERNAASPNDNTRLVTQTLNYVVDPTGKPPQMLRAEVKIPQVEELLGTNAPTTIRFFDGYVKNGFDAATGVFAEVVKEDLNQYTADNPFAGMVANTLGVTFSSDQAGGFATPNLGVSTLSRALGPLAGKVADALTDTFDPASFFKKGLAQLFGSFDLVDLLPASTLGTNAPKLRTQAQDIPGGKLLVASLDWEPAIQNVDLGVAAFQKDYQGNQSELLIHGRIEKPVKLDGTPAGGTTFAFNGTLNDFRVSVLKSVFINFREFGFVSKSGQKTDVKVNLDTAKPVEFDGDLKFVEELRKAIPPDLFGDGPSLDIAPTGIRAGFAFALPPVAVGVFALKDVSLGAALTLPFLDGKPVFDFNVSERAHPFLLTVSIFGGGGFFHLQLDTAGIKQLEAAFEFGAAAAIDLGVASGEVHIMAGIYFAMQRKDPGNDLAAILSGYLRMGGSLSVLGLIKVSVEFNLSFTYDSGKDKAYGRATLTVHVEVAFFSTSVELTVERAFGGKSGDPTFGELINTADAWSEYALAFA